MDGWRIAEHCREHRSDLRVIYATGFLAGEAAAGGGQPVPTRILSFVRDSSEPSVRLAAQGDWRQSKFAKHSEPGRVISRHRYPLPAVGGATDRAPR
jgi:hypothetical protein